MTRLTLAFAAAASALLATPAGATTWTLRFDLLSPAGISCTPSGQASRVGQDLAGKPWLTISGQPGSTGAACTGPDGSRYAVMLPTLRRDRLAASVDVLVLFRQGRDAMPVLVTARDDDWPVVDRASFVRVQ